ncbi:hypothetical protein HanXRQr2_Chr14g0639811 [Helianthus annuus]|uniref:Uncharacterized protein n=1 Tax=Helianthus annuus TaxID=4232 RepID=A0A251TXW2_HELAN|nr:hypothetical protein HanXRQr2_Chr14g0639811 [Helianthus annuus]KAJ0839996.1 hypothetical protein HanPSC8_Chr14g0613471 [Helianthus annuus]
MLLPAGATAVGFGGYVGSSRLDASIATTSDAASSSSSVIDERARAYSKFLHVVFY